MGVIFSGPSAPNPETNPAAGKSIPQPLRSAWGRNAAWQLGPYMLRIVIFLIRISYGGDPVWTTGPGSGNPAPGHSGKPVPNRRREAIGRLEVEEHVSPLKVLFVEEQCCAAGPHPARAVLSRAPAQHRGGLSMGSRSHQPAARWISLTQLSSFLDVRRK